MNTGPRQPAAIAPGEDGGRVVDRSLERVGLLAAGDLEDHRADVRGIAVSKTVRAMSKVWARRLIAGTVNPRPRRVRVPCTARGCSRCGRRAPGWPPRRATAPRPWSRRRSRRPRSRRDRGSRRRGTRARRRSRGARRRDERRAGWPRAGRPARSATWGMDGVLLWRLAARANRTGGCPGTPTGREGYRREAFRPSDERP